MGIDVISLGIIPTPAVAFLTRKYEALAGGVISASHNPGEYNGIKFFNYEGLKLPDSVEDSIEDIILNNKEIDIRPIEGEIGRVYMDNNGINHYKEYLKSIINVDLTGLKIAMDLAISPPLLFFISFSSLFYYKVFYEILIYVFVFEYNK